MYHDPKLKLYFITSKTLKKKKKYLDSKSKI